MDYEKIVTAIKAVCGAGANFTIDTDYTDYTIDSDESKVVIRVYTTDHELFQAFPGENKIVERDFNYSRGKVFIRHRKHDGNVVYETLFVEETPKEEAA